MPVLALVLELVVVLGLLLVMASVREWVTAHAQALEQTNHCRYSDLLPLLDGSFELVAGRRQTGEGEGEGKVEGGGVGEKEVLSAAGAEPLGQWQGGENEREWGRGRERERVAERTP